MPADPVPANAVFAASLGINPDPDADQTAAINAALAGLAPGQALVLAPGTYKISSTLMLQSGTELYGPGATIRASALWAAPASTDPAVATGYAMVANAHFNASELTDTGLTVDGIAFDYDGQNAEGTHAIRFRQASDVQVLNCSFNDGNDGTAFLACDRTLVSGCTATNTTNAAFDAWEGTSDALVTGCSATVASGSGILFTAVGTNPGDDHTSRNLAATNNTITGRFGPSEAGILADSLSANSAVSGVTFTGNVVNGEGGAGSGIGTTGQVSDITISGNTVNGVNGFALFTLADAWHEPAGVTMGSNTLQNNVSPWADGGAESGDHGNLIWLSGPGGSLTTSGSGTVFAHDGAATVTAGAGDNILLYGGSGSLVFNNGSGISTVLGATGSMTVSGGAGGGLFIGGSAGQNSIVGGQAACTILGGGAGDVLQATGSGDNMLVASAGNTTLLGGGAVGNNLFVAQGGDDVIAAGAGHDTIMGGAGTDTITAGPGQDLIVCGAGGGVFVAGTGAATVLGGASVGGGTGGADLYRFINGSVGGNDLICGFRPGTDHLTLSGYAGDAVAATLATAESGGGSTMLHLPDGTQIILAGVAQVTAATFA